MNCSKPVKLNLAHGHDNAGLLFVSISSLVVELLRLGYHPEIKMTLTDVPPNRQKLGIQPVSALPKWLGTSLTNIVIRQSLCQPRMMLQRLGSQSGVHTRCTTPHLECCCILHLSRIVFENHESSTISYDLDTPTC